MVTGAALPLATILRELVARQVGPPAGEWLGQALATVEAAADREAFLEIFAAVARRLGKGPVGLAEEDRLRLSAASVSWPVEAWGVDELGRVALLVAVAARWPAPEVEALVEQCYRQGDARERQAVLRALPFLPAAERFLPVGVEACRTHIQPLFEAIACENPYPARCFPELNFNQMVLKALFTGVALDRIVGLEGRLTPELARMAADYASERRAAGRSVPADIECLTSGRGQER